MPFAVYAMKLLSLAETFHRWLGLLTGLDRANRERIADYAEQIAATLQRAAQALVRLERDRHDGGARAEALREFGRLTGYVDTVVTVLEQYLDGRKIAGVKRRLDQLDVECLADRLDGDAASWPVRLRADRLLVAEGYFRALADGLRT